MRIFFSDEIKAYRLNMFRVANSILRNYADAEDAVGESILKAYANLRKLKSVDRFRPWIMKILVRECYAIQKKRGGIDYYESMEDMAASAEDEHMELWYVVERLPDEFRAIVVLFYYEDMSIGDIAETMGISKGTVKSRLSRARARLKAMLTEGGERRHRHEQF